MQAVRRHIGNVLSQLSVNDTENGGSMSLVSVRKILENNASHHNDGSEGSSNLFYYLFDNWRGAYKVITSNQDRLTDLVSLLQRRKHTALIMCRVKESSVSSLVFSQINWTVLTILESKTSEGSG
jgi:hypothetical protein